MIYQELLSEVLGVEVEYIFIDNSNVNYTTFANITQGTRDCNINIHELAHKCKEWATKQGFKVKAELSYGTEKGKVQLEKYQEFDIYDVFGYKVGHIAKSDWFECDSEPEAIFKACTWIMEDRDD